MTSPQAAADAAIGVPQMFTIHHLIWLHRYGYLPNLPYELGPFPITLDFASTGQFDKRLREQLTDWGVIDVARNALVPEADDLFGALTGFSEWALWGTILLYSLRTNARETFDPGGADDWGLKHAVRDVPRVPFMIAVRNREIISAISTPDALLINRIDRVGDVHQQVGRILKEMLDPENLWEPWGGPTISVPHRTVKSLAADPSVSSMSGDDDADAREARATNTKNALMGAELSPATSKVLVELQRSPTTASVQVAINYTASHGQVTPDLAVGVTFFDGAGIVVSYPVGRTDETRSIRYVPGDEKGFTDAVASLVAAADSVHF